jgi:hypothetical protein
LVVIRVSRVTWTRFLNLQAWSWLVLISIDGFFFCVFVWVSEGQEMQCWWDIYYYI